MPFNIAFDYRFDDSGFYTPDVRRALESAAAIWQDIILDEFDDIAPGHQFEISDPETGEDVVLTLDDAIDDLLIFVGSRDSLSGNTLGVGGYSSGSGASVFRRRTQFSDFEPYIGKIYVDRSENWFFDQTPDTDDDIPLGSYDFITIALHEIGHVLGIGASPTSVQLTAGGKLSGFNVQRLVEYYSDYDLIPVEQDGAHFEEGILGDSTLMDPTLTSGTRTVPSALDRAWLADIGYHIADFNGISYEQQGLQPPLVTGADDRFYGTVLADQIDALSGNDELLGNEGNDHLNGGDGDDQIWGGVGNDSLGGDGGNDSLSGGEHDDWLDGGDGDDQLWGGVGDDYLWGRDGRDSLDGDEGDDHISGGLGNDSLWGSQGADFLIGDDGSDQLSGQEDADRMDGGADDDKLWGGFGSDYLWGGDGNDYLQGDEGGDILIGWSGDDSLWGKDGADTFVFALNNGRDTVNDFDFSSDILELDPGLGFADAADAFARIQIDKPFSNVSRVVFDSENYVDIFHDSMQGSPLAAQHFRVSADSLRGRFDFNLSTTEIRSDIVSGATIANIVLDSPILRDSVSFELASGQGDDDNKHFLIEQKLLVAGAATTLQSSNQYSLRLRATASDGFSIEKSISLSAGESSGQISGGNSSDTAPPVPQSLELSTTNVDLSDGAVTIAATTRLTDDLSGVGDDNSLNAEIRWRSPSGNQFVDASFYAYTSGDDNDATFNNAFPITFNANAETGTWAIEYFRVEDEAGNQKSYSAGELSSLGFNKSIEVTADAAKSILDFTDDGIVDSTDALLMMRHLVGTFPGDTITQGIPNIPDVDGLRQKILNNMKQTDVLGSGYRMDIDGDGTINPLSDGLAIAQYIHAQGNPGGIAQIPDLFENPIHGFDEMQNHLTDLVGF